MTRILSSVVLVGGLFLVFWLWQSQGLASVGVLIVAVAQAEYSRMFLVNRLPVDVKWIFRVFVFMALMVSIWGDSETGIWAVPLICMVMTTWLFIRTVKFSGMELAHKIVNSGVLGLVYVGLLPALTLRLLILPGGINYFCTLLAIVFAGDTFAFFIGVRFGRHRLWELVSPKKSWEGAIGGLFGSVIAAWICGRCLLPGKSVFLLLLTGFLAGSAGQVGDLFESMLKRIAGVKDSGSIMPGHGGMLDRIDGVLFAGVVFWPLIVWWGSR